MASQNIENRIKTSRQRLQRQRPFLDAIGFKPGSRILDIGTGTGVHMEYFAERGMTPVGLDMQDDIFLFKDRFELILSHSNNANIAPESFDYIFSSHVLEHCGDVRAALLQWKKWLKPSGGGMIVIVPPYQEDVVSWHWNIGWNIGQLALFLVAVGLDCSNSMFMNIQGNVCGYGIKREIPQTYMSIKDSFQYFPKGLRDRCVFDERTGAEFIVGNLIEARPTGYIEVPKNETERKLHEAERKLEAVLNSTSWRITEPLREIKRFLTKKGEEKWQKQKCLF